MTVVSLNDCRDLSEEALTNNCLVALSRNKKFFSLGEYKTAGKHGLKRVDLGGRLNSVMNIWLKYNRSKSLINTSKGEPTSPNGLTKLLNKTFESTTSGTLSNGADPQVMQTMGFSDHLIWHRERSHVDAVRDRCRANLCLYSRT